MLSSSRKGKTEIVPTAVNAPDRTKQLERSYSPFQIFQAGTAKSWSLLNGVNRVGRDQDNDIVLNDNSVSRRHARITVSGGMVYIEDSGSRNGVRIGGELRPRANLVVDTIFYLGTMKLLLRRS